mgnify:CR=1 FL=1
MADQITIPKLDKEILYSLTPSREDILAKQQAEQDAAKAKEKADKEQEEKDRAERIQKEIDARQAASAENFTLGQSAEDALAGQGDVFNQPEPKQEPAAQATAILDAAEVKGKERIDILKDVKNGAITPEEVQAAYPAKEAAKIEDVGEKIGGARKDTAISGVAMYSRGDNNQLAKAWQQVAQSPGIFRYKTSTAKTMEQVLASTVPDFIVENVGGDEDFADSWTVYAKDKDGNPDELRNAHVLLYKDGKVELNVYRLGEGNLGSELYAAVGNWAYNNGHVFAADRMGASPVGVQRRLENMISLALKFGSTDFIMPSNPKELGWIDGDTVHNLEQMLKASYADLVSKLPEIENASYDFASGRFSPDVTPELIQRARASGIQGGEGTIKRGIVTASLLRVLRSGEAIGPISRDGSSLNGIAYSKGDGLDAFRASLSKLSAPPATDPKVIAQVQAWTDELSAKWTNAPDIRVVASSADLPVPATSDTRGLYYRGTVYVVASRVGSKRAVGEVLAHESVDHYGLREMLGQTDWQRFMGNIQLAIKTGNKPLNAIRDQIRSVYVDENGNPNLPPEQEADEIAARVAEMAIDENGEFKPGFAFVKSVYAKIAQFLRDMGLNVQMTHLELQGALINAQRYLEAGNRTAGGGYPLMIAARGDAKAARNDQTQTPEFKRWFGDSVVTDNGKPMNDGFKHAANSKPFTVLVQV